MTQTNDHESAPSIPDRVKAPACAICGHERDFGDCVGLFCTSCFAAKRFYDKLCRLSPQGERQATLDRFEHALRKAKDCHIHWRRDIGPFRIQCERDGDRTSLFLVWAYLAVEQYSQFDKGLFWRALKHIVGSNN